jgi:hypothetical protein
MGTVKVVVSNNGPCTANATLSVRVSAGNLDVHPPGEADSRVKVVATSWKGNYHHRTVTETVDNIYYNMSWGFTLSPGARETVEIDAQDTTPRGQTLPYSFLYLADVTGDLPDPNSSNNGTAILRVTFDPPKNTPAKPTPSKPQ